MLHVYDVDSGAISDSYLFEDTKQMNARPISYAACACDHVKMSDNEVTRPMPHATALI